MANALRPLDKQWFRNRYFKIDPTEYALPGQLCEEDFEYTWAYFEGVREHYAKAASEGRWSIFTVDQ